MLTVELALGGGWQCKAHDESLAKVGFDGFPVLGRAVLTVELALGGGYRCKPYDVSPRRVGYDGAPNGHWSRAKKSPRKPGAKNTAYDQILMIPRNSRMELTKIIARMMGATNFMMTT